MKMREAAAASGCHPETIRYYERIGLLPHPGRTHSGYRQFTTADVARLRFVTRGRDLGFSLEEIGSLLGLAEAPSLSCTEVDGLARKHLLDIQHRIQDLQRMAAELERTITQCRAGQRAECPILETLRHPAAGVAAGAGN